MRLDLKEFPAFLRNFGLVLLAGGVLQGAFEMWSAAVYIVSIAGLGLMVISFLRK